MISSEHTCAIGMTLPHNQTSVSSSPRLPGAIRSIWADGRHARMMAASSSAGIETDQILASRCTA